MILSLQGMAKTMTTRLNHLVTYMAAQSLNIILTEDFHHLKSKLNLYYHNNHNSLGLKILLLHKETSLYFPIDAF